MSKGKFQIGDKIYYLAWGVSKQYGRVSEIIDNKLWCNLWTPKLEDIDKGGSKGWMYEKDCYLVEQTPKPKFQIGDKVRVLDNATALLENYIGEVGEIVRFMNDDLADIEFENGDIARAFSKQYNEYKVEIELISESKSQDEKLIKSKKMDIKDIQEFDKKALAEAKKEVLKERSEAQKVKGMEFLREVYAEKDNAEEVIKDANKKLEVADENLKVFNTK